MSWPDTHTDFLSYIVAYTHHNAKKKNSHSKQLGQNNAHEVETKILQSCGHKTRISDVFNLGTFSSTIADAVRLSEIETFPLCAQLASLHLIFATMSSRLIQGVSNNRTHGTWQKKRALTCITETEFLQHSVRDWFGVSQTVSHTGLGTNKKIAKNRCTWKFFVSWASQNFFSTDDLCWNFTSRGLSFLIICLPSFQHTDLTWQTKSWSASSLWLQRR